VIFRSDVVTINGSDPGSAEALDLIVIAQTIEISGSNSFGLDKNFKLWPLEYLVYFR